MIVGLECSKFNFYSTVENAGFSRVDFNSPEVSLSNLFLKFPSHLDTQDFCFVNDCIVVIHHKACINKNTSFYNVELYPDCHTLEPKFRVKGIKLPNDENLKYPTCLTSYENWLFLGVAGENFRSGIFIYDLTNPTRPKLHQYLELSHSKTKNPYGLNFDGERLLVSYFADNSIDYFKIFLNEKTNEFVSTIKSTMLGNPLTMATYKDVIYCVGHSSCDLILVEIIGAKLQLKKIAISGGCLNGPWGICTEGEKIYVSNLGLQDRSLPHVVALRQINENELKIESTRISNGAAYTVLRQIVKT